MERIICLLIGYAVGLFQTGYIYGRLNHIDIREHGSGNAGTTNAMRTLGKKAGIITYVGDTIKAIVAAIIVYFVFGKNNNDMWIIYTLYCGIGVILGHNFPFYLGFKGGKGIATSSGVILTLIPFNWVLSVLACSTFIVITLISKYVSLGSLVMMAAFFVEIIIWGQVGFLHISDTSVLPEVYVLAFIISALAFVRHRANIVRLINGTERKIGQKKEV